MTTDSLAIAPTSLPIPSIPTTVSIPIEVRALSYWAKNYVFEIHEIPQMSHEYFTYVPHYWSRAGTDSSLHLALCALSQALFAQSGNTHMAIDDAEKVYARAIIKTHKEMEALSSDRIDELLLAIMLMATYEVLLRTCHENSIEPPVRLTAA
jgi:hypothetical protein